MARFGQIAKARRLRLPLHPHPQRHILPQHSKPPNGHPVVNGQGAKESAEPFYYLVDNLGTSQIGHAILEMLIEES